MLVLVQAVEKLRVFERLRHVVGEYLDFPASLLELNDVDYLVRCCLEAEGQRDRIFVIVLLVLLLIHLDQVPALEQADLGGDKDVIQVFQRFIWNRLILTNFLYLLRRARGLLLLPVNEPFGTRSDHAERVDQVLDDRQVQVPHELLLFARDFERVA